MWRTTEYFIYNNDWHITNGNYFGCPYFIMNFIGGKRHDHLAWCRRAQDPEGRQGIIIITIDNLVCKKKFV